MEYEIHCITKYRNLSKIGCVPILDPTLHAWSSITKDLYTRRQDVSRPIIAKSRSHKTGFYNDRITLKFDKHLRVGSTAARAIGKVLIRILQLQDFMTLNTIIKCASDWMWHWLINNYYYQLSLQLGIGVQHIWKQWFISLTITSTFVLIGMFKYCDYWYYLEFEISYIHRFEKKSCKMCVCLTT